MTALSDDSIPTPVRKKVAQQRGITHSPQKQQEQAQGSAEQSQYEFKVDSRSVD